MDNFPYQHDEPCETEMIDESAAPYQGFANLARNERPEPTRENLILAVEKAMSALGSELDKLNTVYDFVQGSDVPQPVIELLFSQYSYLLRNY